MINPSAILFDMDGVLVKSLDSWWKSLNTALEKNNMKRISRDRFIEKFWGDELQKNLERLQLELSVKNFCKNIFNDHVESVELFDNTKDILKELKNYKKAIITNTPKECALKILEKFDIKKYFDVVITNDQIKKGKPDPEIVFKACKELNVVPEKCVLVGDTKNDIKAGKKAGCIVIGINLKGDYKINNIGELKEIIEV